MFRLRRPRPNAGEAGILDRYPIPGAKVCREHAFDPVEAARDDADVPGGHVVLAETSLRELDEFGLVLGVTVEELAGFQALHDRLEIGKERRVRVAAREIAYATSRMLPATATTNAPK